MKRGAVCWDGSTNRDDLGIKHSRRLIFCTDCSSAHRSSIIFTELMERNVRDIHTRHI